jgi:hypothetical protein
MATRPNPEIESGINARSRRYPPCTSRPATRSQLRRSGAGFPFHNETLDVYGITVHLKGDLKGLWSLTVTGNWRLIFRYDERTDTASDIDLIDYH